MLSLRLPVGHGDHAAINFYSTREGAFTKQDVTVASVVVPLAALAIEGGRPDREHADLLEALESSRHISTAVGIVMDTQGITSDEALDLLQGISAEFGVNLRVVADKVTFLSSVAGRPDPDE